MMAISDAHGAPRGLRSQRVGVRKHARKPAETQPCDLRLVRQFSKPAGKCFRCRPRAIYPDRTAVVHIRHVRRQVAIDESLQLLALNVMCVQQALEVTLN